MIPSRRSFLTGLIASLVTAPAIVRAASLMPVKVMPADEVLARLATGHVADMSDIYAELSAATRRAFVPPLHVQIYLASPFLAFSEQLRAES